MNTTIKEALRRKDRARTAREDGDLERAAPLIEDACRLLEVLWGEYGDTIDAAGSAAGADERDLVEALAEVHGIRGGLYRSMGRYADAAAAYDRGFEFEIHPARSKESLYNRVQRLLNRVLWDPGAIRSAGWHVGGLDLWAELADAEKALRATSLSRDPWAAADRLVVVFLQKGFGDDVEKAWSELRALEPKAFVWKSTLRTLQDLRRELEHAPTHPSVQWAAARDGSARLVERFQEALDKAKGE
ncbi:MAG TPA: hypothetical protein VE871_18710 [Longimicrobium sp.]|nr:hypothetical protein [Longimicrobium sp.]